MYMLIVNKKNKTTTFLHFIKTIYFYYKFLYLQLCVGKMNAMKIILQLKSKTAMIIRVCRIYSLNLGSTCEVTRKIIVTSFNTSLTAYLLQNCFCFLFLG